jgi:tripartite-type tricarboxylate transporter receptor subunit TctC
VSTLLRFDDDASARSVDTVHQPARRRVLALALGGAAAAVVRPAHAQPAPDWPRKPVQVVVPYGPGGSVDVIVRIVGEHAAQTLGQPIVVLNRPGGNANIGPAQVAQSPADGYTLLASSSATVINPIHDPKLGWNRDSFVPIARIAQVSNLIVVPASSGTRTLAEFVARARANPGLPTPVTGFGSSQAVARELFARAAGIRLLDVAYKGGTTFVADLVAGRLAVSVSPLNVVMQLVKDGQLNALANTGERRSPLMPDVPTMIESGFPDATSVSWMGLHAPAGTPPAAVSRMSAALRAALADESVRARLNGVGAEPGYLDTAAFLPFLEVETARAQKYVATLDTAK